MGEMEITKIPKNEKNEDNNGTTFSWIIIFSTFVCNTAYFSLEYLLVSKMEYFRLKWSFCKISPNLLFFFQTDFPIIYDGGIWPEIYLSSEKSNLFVKISEL